MTVPLAASPEFITRTGAVLPRQAAGGGRQAGGRRVSCFDHVGEGNRHSSVYLAVGRNRVECDDLLMRVSGTVHELVDSLAGSVSPGPSCRRR